ncbi:hypothetical protein PTSG_03336 [Salpingoeca rosetta]|uniref:BSD domain-containing protein n=1 Tax=Salpingoeca rosetta (strain ATCC 50818 / BSB-021) TaxID=946362 RepID=F2U4V9_SALR5|nr:uncharacterized protein PTSG_03336 [Salpingoeca rosetta]EGD82675.1 hypothetical protein PTSG_03336 [Salpingoeca rosetta]|eukprot:XP_004995911.1 hypothetical protein PTSG_03336 [Salpingoeca rosetta]
MFSSFSRILSADPTPNDERQDDGTNDQQQQQQQQEAQEGQQEERQPSSSSSSVMNSFFSRMQGFGSQLKQGVNQVTSVAFSDFDKEHQKFMQEKHAKLSGAAVPPWVGCDDEEELRSKILALSNDERNVTRDPPPGAQFDFDFDVAFPIAQATLLEDHRLDQLRFKLVPKAISEHDFWRNYFYRVELIKQSTDMARTMAQNTDQLSRGDARARRSSETQHRTERDAVSEGDDGGDDENEGEGEGEGRENEKKNEAHAETTDEDTQHADATHGSPARCSADSGSDDAASNSDNRNNDDVDDDDAGDDNAGNDGADVNAGDADDTEDDTKATPQKDKAEEPTSVFEKEGWEDEVRGEINSLQELEDEFDAELAGLDLDDDCEIPDDLDQQLEQMLTEEDLM